MTYALFHVNGKKKKRLLLSFPLVINVRPLVGWSFVVADGA